MVLNHSNIDRKQIWKFWVRDLSTTQANPTRVHETAQHTKYFTLVRHASWNQQLTQTTANTKQKKKNMKMLYDFSIYGVVYRCSVVANALSPGDQKVSGSIPPPPPRGRAFSSTWQAPGSSQSPDKWVPGNSLEKCKGYEDRCWSLPQMLEWPRNVKTLICHTQKTFTSINHG